MERLIEPKLLIGAVILIAVVITSGIVYVALTPSSNTIIMYTTTSTDNSGLLQYLEPMWEKATGINVKWVPVGTGAAIQSAEQGEADVVMVHARSLEDQFVNAGYGFHRVSLMHNDFVLVGPASDPAGVNGMANATQVFQKLYHFLSNQTLNPKYNIKFESRGDDSGTNVKELTLWNESGIHIDDSNKTWADANSWYSSLGAGMGKTLTTTGEQNSYTLTDRATFLKLSTSSSGLPLTILAQNSTSDTWANPYGVILVNPAAFPNLNIKMDLAKRYVEWLISNQGQAAINAYKINHKQVFFADFQNLKSELNSTELAFWGLS